MRSFLFILLISLILCKPIKEDLGNGIYYIGVNDDNIRQFEGQYPVDHGMAYNWIKISKMNGYKISKED